MTFKHEGNKTKLMKKEDFTSVDHIVRYERIV